MKLERRGFLAALAGLLVTPFLPKKADPAPLPDPYNLDIGRSQESLADVIYQISPSDTPFLEMANRHEINMHEWTSDELKPIEEMRESTATADAASESGVR